MSEGAPSAAPDGQSRVPDMFFWIGALALVGVSRLPYLTSPNFMVEGDESILGLMAKHLSEGRDFPLFFYGQAYGFSLVETLPAAIAFRVFGATPQVLTGTMLALFFVGLVLYERGFRALTGNREWSRLLTLVLALTPLWIVWGAKARGGHLSAFVLTGAILAALAVSRIGTGRAISAGVAVGLVAAAQPLWLPVAALLLLLPWARRHDPRYLMPATLSAVLVTMALAALGRAGGDPYWQPEVSGAHFETIRFVPQQLFALFTGFFYIDETFPAPGLIVLSAWLMTTLFFLAICLAPLGFLLRRERLNALVPLLLLAPLTVVPFLGTLPPRHLMAASVATFVAGAAAMGQWLRPQHRWWVRGVGGAALLLLSVGSLGMADRRPMHRDSNTDVTENLMALIDFLDENNIQAVYSTDGLLQWQVMFFSQERIVARYFHPTDRYPAYPAHVDSVLAAGGRTALVGPVSGARHPAHQAMGDDIYEVGQDYFAIPDPQREPLVARGFRFIDRRE